MDISQNRELPRWGVSLWRLFKSQPKRVAFGCESVETIWTSFRCQFTEVPYLIFIAMLNKNHISLELKGCNSPGPQLPASFEAYDELERRYANKNSAPISRATPKGINHWHIPKGLVGAVFFDLWFVCVCVLLERKKEAAC